jgi:thioredoxin reductase
VEAIEMRMAAPSQSGDSPILTSEHETNIENLFVAGELGGLALIRNAVNEGRECIDTITARLAARPSEDSNQDRYDVCIVGAGPAGISASLRAIENRLHYLTLEESDIGGTVAKYPRQKLVMTSPVEFPLYGTFRKMTLSKEELLAFWKKVSHNADFVAHTQEKMEDVQKEPDGGFSVLTSRNRYRATAVILALGKNGTPRKLGVQGEDLPKVMYRLIEADAYKNSDIVVVGGGDSALEAAMGLALQKGNRVVLSYRGDSFRKIKERNAQRIEEYRSSGKIEVLFSSNLIEISEKNVVLDGNGSRREIPNDFVWILAGGTPPKDLLQKIGIQFGAQIADITS